MVVAVLLVVSTDPAGTPAAAEVREAGPKRPGETPVSTFVSIPDLFNTDVGDVSGLPGWRPGFPNSTNASWETAAATVLDAVAAENPNYVLAAGDLVRGEWHQDHDGLGIFGHHMGRGATQRAVQSAADTYYSQWLQRLSARNLKVFAAVGDHEIGDNPWKAGSRKTRLVPTFKSAWAKHFTTGADGHPRFHSRPVGTPYENTAYSKRFGPVLLVTLDEFVQAADGAVTPGVSDDQLAWLDSVLAAAAADPTITYTIVQGHCPVLTPVRAQASSSLTIPGGAQSALWDTMRRHGVDLYLAGEVHQITSTNEGGVEQIAHGGHIGATNESNYLVGRVYDDRLDLELRQAPVTGGGSDVLWQMGHARSPAERIVGAFTTVGTLTVSADGAESNRTGYFEPYVPQARQAPFVRVGRARVGEQNAGVTPAVFPVTLSAPATETVTVRYTTAPGAAVAGEDFEPVQGELQILPGETTASVSVPVIPDTLDERAESFFLHVAADVRGATHNARGLGSIVDDDVRPTLTIGDASIIEGAAGAQTMAIQASLSAPSGRAVAFVWKTKDGTAVAGEDYARTEGDYVFLPGEVSTVIEVPVYGDAVVEGDEAFSTRVVWKSRASAAEAVPSAVIVDDDGPPAPAGSR